jgi:uncharacterized protein
MARSGLASTVTQAPVLELEGLRPENLEFEAAARCVRFEGQATMNIREASPNPSGRRAANTIPAFANDQHPLPKLHVPSSGAASPALIFEFLLLFFLLPLAFRFKPFPFPPIPALWLLALYCWYRLRSDPSFDRTRLWSAAQLPGSLPQILMLFVAVALLTVLGVWWFSPEKLFSFPRRTPAFWALVMLLYPVLSVYPQTLVYRVFICHRYRTLLASPLGLILASAVAFAFVHIIFRNPIAVTFTLVGGVLFAWRNLETGSALTSAFEHSLYGCLMFTVGLGQYFYQGFR